MIFSGVGFGEFGKGMMLGIFGGMRIGGVMMSGSKMDRRVGWVIWGVICGGGSVGLWRIGDGGGLWGRGGNGNGIGKVCDDWL